MMGGSKFFCGLVLLVLLGCSKRPLQPLTLSEVPDALMTAFATAETTIKFQAEFVASSVRSNQLAAASVTLNDLVAAPKLTKEQRLVASRAQIAVNQEIRAATEDPAQGGNSPRREAARGPNPAGPAAAPEEAAAAAAALRVYQQSK